MNFTNIEEIRADGFTGFKSMNDLFNDTSSIPKIKGIYMVLNLANKPPEFLPVGSGGHFKGKNPNVSVAELKANWVNDTIVVYIGKAGKDGSNATLHSRLRQYIGFGKGGNVGHWGGRLIWQLKNSKDLVICWKALPSEDPRTAEKKYIEQFFARHSARPFANLAD